MSLNITMLASIRAAVKDTPQYYARAFVHVMSARDAFKTHCHEQAAQFDRYEKGIRYQINKMLKQTMLRQQNPNKTFEFLIDKPPHPPLTTPENKTMLAEYVLDDYRRAGWKVKIRHCYAWTYVQFGMEPPYCNGGGGGGGCGTNTSCGGVGPPTSLDVDCDNDNL